MSSGPKPETGSNECFYVTPDGKKDDLDIHEDILGETEDEDRALYLRRAIESGMDPELAESLYG